jgi:hypothetical protein
VAASIQPAVAPTVVETAAAAIVRANNTRTPEDAANSPQLWEELSAEGTRSVDASTPPRERHAIRIITVNF